MTFDPLILKVAVAFIIGITFAHVIELTVPDPQPKICKMKPVTVKQVGRTVAAREKPRPTAPCKYGELIAKYWPKSEWKTACEIAKAESNLNPKAIGDREIYPHSYGLFQVRAFSSRGTGKQLLNPDYNVRVAARLYKSGGYTHWSVCRKGIVKCWR